MSSNAQIMRLSLSDNVSLEYVLSDIPFFCVGLTALAVFVFFMVMRRVNLPAIYLYTSSLLAFGAAILDLTQILLRGTTNTDEGLATGTVTGIINTREVGLALAFGFRFLYLWAFVAQRPRYEPRQTTQESSFEVPYHSGSWERWGAPGLVLKYALLGSVISIPVLQIIWRIATGFSAVYVAESTVQIAVSVLLIAKIMLNLFLSTVGPWWRPFTPYIVPVIALLISTGIGAGNLLFFKFSETTLGRFLQAVETYSLILSLLIFTFYNVPRSEPATVPAPRKRSSFFTGFQSPKREQSQYQESFPVAELPVIQIGRGVASSDRPTSRESTISRLSSWINVRRPPQCNSGEQKLWNTGDAEMGISTEMRASTPDGSVEEGPMSPAVNVSDEQRRAPLTVNTTERQNSAPLTPMLELPTPSTSRPFTGVSFASYYGMASNSRLTLPGAVRGDDSRNTDSPVYGLNGILTPAGPAAPESPILSRRPPSSPPPPESPSDQRDSLNSFDELLRQQTELDRSIAALRLFSPTTTVMSIPSPPDAPKLSSADVNSRSFSVSSNKSVSNRSEFSLSIFPDPPPAESVLPESLSTGSGRARDPPFPTARTRRQSRIPRSAISTKDGTEDLSVNRFDSAGTQYDVTSFIGDLMIPGSSEPKMGVLGEVAETESDMESPVISTATPGPALRPLLLSSAAPSITSLPPAAASSGLLPASAQQPTNYEYPVLKPLLLGSASGVPSPLSAGARRTPGSAVFNGPRRPAARAGQGRPVISGPRQQEERVEETEAFEKPRRPPALTPER
ncbi:hypothetical protein B0H17DRAFT_133913 [Mycena rosella]|uniref:Uncharacterized protein n=1 Tax=Mycena rosella TaxID=1033263 RepID=A0AAD7D2A2_MYCRO|nr:hypothetical protein B0H17DRAFT_133913 [Mycena rosella]